MKKFLLATVALVALAAPALGADMGPRSYNKAPVYAAPLYNWTGFYLGAHLGGAFSGSNNFNGLVLWTTQPVCWAASRPAPITSSRRTGLSVPKASTPGSARTTSMRPSPTP